MRWFLQTHLTLENARIHHLPSQQAESKNTQNPLIYEPG